MALLGDMMKDVTTMTPMATMAPLGGMAKGVTTMTAIVTMALLGDMMKDVTTMTAIVTMAIIFNKGAQKISVSGTEEEMNCRKVCMYVLAEECIITAGEVVW